MNYNLGKLIESGEQAILKNPRRDLSLLEFQQLSNISEDKYATTSAAFCAGVAVGLRMAKVENRRRR